MMVILHFMDQSHYTKNKKMKDQIIELFIEELKQWKDMDTQTTLSAINLVRIVNDFLDEIEDLEEE